MHEGLCVQMHMYVCAHMYGSQKLILEVARQGLSHLNPELAKLLDLTHCIYWG